MPGGYVCSASMKGKADNDDGARGASRQAAAAQAVLEGAARVLRAPRARGRRAQRPHRRSARRSCSSRTSRPPELGRRLVAELWLIPDGTRVLELSTKCLPAEAFQVAIEARAYLEGLGLDLAPDPQTKTKTTLEFFSREAPGGLTLMAEVLLFHHAQGLTPGFAAFADELRRAGHTVHTPDLFDGAHVRQHRRGHGPRRARSASASSSSAAAGPRTSCPPSSCTPASRSACCRRRSWRRPGRARGARCCSTPACRSSEFGAAGPRACRRRSTGWTPTRSSSARATSTPRASWSSRGGGRRAVPLPGRPALLRRLEPAVVRRGRRGAADPAGARVSAARPALTGATRVSSSRAPRLRGRRTARRRRRRSPCGSCRR